MTGISKFSAIGMPELETERLTLRAWRESDLDLIDGIYSDEENARYVGGVHTREQSWRYIASQIGHWHFRGYGMWVIERKSDGAPTGYSGLWYPEGWPEPEIGFIYHRKFHGNGYATEAAREILHHAYTNLGWKTAISMIDTRNDASKNVAAKLGGKFEKTGILFGQTPAEIWRHLPPTEFTERFA